MEVLQRNPECSQPEACNVLESASAAIASQPLSCPNHEGKVRQDYRTGYIELKLLYVTLHCSLCR